MFLLKLAASQQGTTLTAESLSTDPILFLCDIEWMDH